MSSQPNILQNPKPGREGTQETVPQQIQLVSKKLPIRYCEFKISNNVKKMFRADSQGLSSQGIQFTSTLAFEPGVLMRVWIELPDFWARKSRHVGYRHTDAPTWFQMLARVISCDEMNKRGSKFQLLCESVNMDPNDDKVLRDFLGLGEEP